jgi:OmpA-OmpF porin, OOP family
MYKKALAAVAVVFSSGVAQVHAADAKPGWYAGLDVGAGRTGIGASEVDGALANQGVAGSSSVDSSGTAFGVNGGYRLNRNFGVEAAWDRLGRFDYGSNTGADTVNGTYEANALSLAGVGFLPLSNALSLYGKAGLAVTDAKLSASSASGATAVGSTSHTGTGLLVGAGLTYDFEQGYFAKAGWDHYAHVGDASTGSGDINTYMVGVGLHF